MIDVDILVVEDKYVDPDAIEEIDFSSYSNLYLSFRWHQSFNPDQLVILESAEFTAYEIYQRYLNYFNGLEDRDWGIFTSQSIVILDLNFQGIHLDDSETKEIGNWIGQNDWSRLKNSRGETGLYILGKLLDNKSWSGVIGIATSYKTTGDLNLIIKTIEQYFDRKDVSVIIGGSVTTGRLDVVHQSITEFKRKFGDIQNKLWPLSTKKWFYTPTTEFESNESLPPVPHNLPDDEDKRKKCLQEIRKYLKNLVGNGFEFNDFTLEFLFEDLKHLIGSQARASGMESNRNLTLSNALLLLASACKSDNTEWWQEINWDKHQQVLSGYQDSEQAQAAILSLYKLFQVVLTKKTGALTPPKVKKVSLNKNSLQILLDWGDSDSWENDFIDFVTNKINERGDFRGQWRKFTFEAGNTKRGRESLCVLNIYFTDGKELCLEIRTCV